MARTQTGRRSRARSASSSPRPRRARAARQVAAKPSLLSRIVRIIWISPWHAALALAIGVVCGALSSRVGGMIAPPYAAILGTLVVYPVLVAVWWRMPQPAWRRR
jgi:hypothetical protein